MANRREVGSILAIAGFTLLTACSGLYLGFVAPRAMPHGKPVAHVPDQGPVVYEMHSIVSKPNRVRLEWRDVPGATGYRITVMSAQDESLFVSPRLPRNSWVIPSHAGSRFESQTVYHWKVTVFRPEGVEVSEASAFATQ
jgi:hypothetical protein